MEKKLPSVLTYDLEGFRGFGITDFPLTFIDHHDVIVGSYCNDKAGYALYTEVGETKEDVIAKLYEKIAADKIFSKILEKLT